MAQKRAQFIELRIDLMERREIQHIRELVHSSDLPTIFTLRRKDQGGHFSGSEEERERILLELTQLHPSYVDLEYDVHFRDKIPSNIRVIASYHNFEKTPEDLHQIFHTMKRFRADIYKIVCMARSSLDALRMLIFVKEHTNVSGICMGKYGTITRILAPVVGNALTYAPFTKKEATASGQISIPDLINIYHFNQLNQRTKIYALIGNPINTSIGHLIHNAIFQKYKENAVYVKLALLPKEISTLFTLLPKLPFKGFSVTMPLKECVIPYLERIEHKACKICAVNTLLYRNGKWWGYNTDAEGALDAIENRENVMGKTILILGAGGAARALAYESIKRGGKIIIANRTEKKAKILAKQFTCQWMKLEAISSLKYDILINTTCVGMAPNIENIPISPTHILKRTTIFDIILSPKETRLLHIAKKRGCSIIYGHEMYARQALKQLELWLGSSLNCDTILHRVQQCIPF